MTNPFPQRSRGRAGFSLVEVALALGIAGFCLAVVFGLLPVGVKVNRASIEQTGANGILSALAADLRATPPTSPLGQAATSPQFAIPIPANPVPSTAASKPATFFFDGNNKCSTAPTQNSRDRLTITFLANGANVRAATLVSIRATWPAAAAVVNAEGSVTTFLALDRN